MFAIRRDGEAEDAFLVAFKLGDGFSITGIPNLDNTIIAGTNQIFAIGVTVSVRTLSLSALGIVQRGLPLVSKFQQ